jgi:hypothetical protein
MHFQFLYSLLAFARFDLIFPVGVIEYKKWLEDAFVKLFPVFLSFTPVAFRLGGFGTLVLHGFPLPLNQTVEQARMPFLYILLDFVNTITDENRQHSIDKYACEKYQHNHA